MTKVYLSGPMTGYPDFNYPAFNQAALVLREMGYEVFNPAEQFGGNQDLAWTDYMKADIAAILECDEVRVLDGWDKSLGARLEVAVAFALGMRVQPLHGFWPDEYDARKVVETILNNVPPQQQATESILEEAARLVGGDRQADYGHPAEDFAKTALMWTGLALDRLKPGEQFTARDVPLFMNAVKMSREINRPKRDNRVDGAGYWQTLQMVDEYEQRKQ